MNKLKSVLLVFALGAVAGTSVGCYTDHDRHRRVYEPSGSSRDDRYNRYERDRDYYEGRRYDRDWNEGRYYDGRYEERHQWDNPNYRR